MSGCCCATCSLAIAIKPLAISARLVAVFASVKSAIDGTVRSKEDNGVEKRDSSFTLAIYSAAQVGFRLSAFISHVLFRFELVIACFGDDKLLTRADRAHSDTIEVPPHVEPRRIDELI